MIRVGVAGWDYPDWNGVVYPTAVSRRFDRLAHVARLVDVIEINSTFYRPAAPATAAAWLARTLDLPDFRFAAKVHRSWTHEPYADLDQAVRDTLAGLRPLHEAGRLIALLVQFPQSFRYSESSLARLEALAPLLEGWPWVVEVRHASWESEAAERWFARRGVGWCAVDQPRAGSAQARLVPRVTAPIAYLRLHGRNATDWFRPDAGRDARYDYLYTRAQVEELAAIAQRMAERAESLVVVQNNHFRGQAVANALQMKHLLGGPRPLAPHALVAAFPELAADVRVERTRLF